MIDREKVIKGLEELEGFLFKEYTNIKAEESKIYYDRFKSLSDAIDMLKEQEAVKPVKLVRCKNCRHCDGERIDKNMIWCKIHQFGRPDDYYCADGIEK